MLHVLFFCLLHFKIHFLFYSVLFLLTLFYCQFLLCFSRFFYFLEAVDLFLCFSLSMIYLNKTSFRTDRTKIYIYFSNNKKMQHKYT